MIPQSETPTDGAVHSFDEWSDLREVIVGRAEGLRETHLDNSFSLMYWTNVRPYLAANNYFRDEQGVPRWTQVSVDPRFVDETIEDLEGFVAALTSAGVVVRRPSAMVGEGTICTPFWRSLQSPPLNIRDQTLVLGRAIVETAPQIRARSFENDYLKPLFYEYFAAGAEWYSMPRPTLAAGGLDTEHPELTPVEHDAMSDHHAAVLRGLPKEIAFDAAQCVRLGADVLVNVGNKNHELGYRWLQATLGHRFRFHRLDHLAPDHVDSFLLPLRPGLWLVRETDILKFLPHQFASWDVIVAPEAEHDRFPSYAGTSFPIVSKHIDMNVLSISESVVVVNSLYPELIQVLEGCGFDVIPVRLRHRRLIGGGFHCLTLDTRRTGECETYA